MTGAERDAFRLLVQGCWVVDPGSQAGRVTVKVKLTKKAHKGLKRQHRTLRIALRVTFTPASGAAANASTRRSTTPTASSGVWCSGRPTTGSSSSPSRPPAPAARRGRRHG